MSSPYGICPDCGAKGITRERRPNGFDICSNGHRYKSNKALHPDIAPLEFLSELKRIVNWHHASKTSLKHDLIKEIKLLIKKVDDGD